MDLVSHTDYAKYNVAPYANGTLQINIASATYMSWLSSTIGVYFTDINDLPVHNPQVDLSSNWGPEQSESITTNDYNAIVLIPELSSGIPTLTNLSYNIEVPENAVNMYWFQWQKSAPSETTNYNWNLSPMDRFLLVTNNPTSTTQMLRWVFTRKTYYRLDGETVARAANTEVRGYSIYGSDNFVDITRTSDLDGIDYRHSAILSDTTDPNGKLNFYRDGSRLSTTNYIMASLQGIEVYGNAYVNQAPTAVAPSDVTVFENTNVPLSASASSDPDGDSLTYQWTQIAGPSVTINNPTQVIASITTPDMHWSDSNVTITLQVEVSDGNNPPVTDTVNIYVQPEPNSAPVIASFENISVNGGTTVILRSNEAYDPDGDALTYQWTQISGPEVSITDSTVRDLEVSFPTVPYGMNNPNIVEIEGVITDIGGLTATKLWRVGITREENQNPLAIAQKDKSFYNSGEVVTINGDASTDPENGGLTYEWTFVSSTDNNQPTLSSTTTSVASFTSPTLNEGDTDVSIEYLLTVTDNGGLTSTDTVVITIKAPVAEVIPGCNKCGIEYTLDTIILHANISDTYSTTPEPITYDLYTCQVVNDGTSGIKTLIYYVDGNISEQSGYLGDNNVVFKTRTQVPARTKRDLETYGYSYVLSVPVGRLSEDNVHYTA